MNSRERIMAALHAQPVDRIPLVPLIDQYTLVDAPPELTGGWTASYDDLPGFRGLLAASRALGCDVMLRHVPILEPAGNGMLHLENLGRFAPPVQARLELSGDQRVEVLRTPQGSLTGVWKFTDRVGWIPHPVRHAVTSYEELKIFHYAVDHLDSGALKADYEMYRHLDREIGPDGIATVSLWTSPLMFLIEEVCGLEATYYLLQDHRQEVEDILAKLHTSLKRYAELLAAGPAEVVIQYEDTSSTLMSPAIFSRYCLPYLNEYAQIVGGAAKIFLVHMCGKLRHLVTPIGGGRFAGVTEVSPPPTGDLPLDEAAASLPGKVVVGGIDPTTFISGDLEAVKREVSGLIECVKAYPGVLLGSADTTPRGTRAENLQLIRSLVDELGAYAHALG